MKDATNAFRALESAGRGTRKSHTLFCRAEQARGCQKKVLTRGRTVRNATKEKAFVGLWNPGSRGHFNQTAARVSGSAP